MSKSHSAEPIPRAKILHLAAEAGIDPRTAAKALREGPDALRSVADRERVREALAATKTR